MLEVATSQEEEEGEQNQRDEEPPAGIINERVQGTMSDKTVFYVVEPPPKSKVVKFGFCAGFLGQG